MTDEENFTHRSIETDWEEVSRLTDKLDDPERNAYEWFSELVERERDDLKDSDTAMLLVWTKNGKIACFRMGWRLILAGLAKHAADLIAEDMQAADDA